MLKYFTIIAKNTKISINTLNTFIKQKNNN